MGMWAKFPFTWLPELLNTKKTTTKKPIDKEGPIYFSVPEINITWFYYAMLDETICLCKYIFSSGHLLPQLFKETNYFRISSSTLWHMLFFHWNNSLCWERQSWVGKRKKWKNLRIVSFSLNVLYLPLVFWSIFYTVGWNLYTLLCYRLINGYNSVLMFCVKTIQE